MSRYKVEVRNSPDWRNHSAVTLGVSVTSPNWQGDKLQSILDFAASNFETIRIDVTDALYRHSFMAKGEQANEALAKANALGALWIAQHQDMINASPIKSKIIRWARWYEHPEFERSLRKFQQAHETNGVLREAINKDVLDFYRRKNVKPTLLEIEHSKNYLIEEMAVLTLQAITQPGVRLYPGDELESLRVVRSGLIPSAPKGLELEQFAKVKFVHRKPIPTEDQHWIPTADVA